MLGGGSIKSYKIVIPGRLPGMNEIIGSNRYNRYSGSKQKKENTKLCAIYAKKAKLRPIDKKVDVEITWYEINKRRDKDNIIAGQKFIFDGLVMAGLIPNDGWGEIGDISYKFKVDKKRPRVEVVLTEV